MLKAKKQIIYKGDERWQMIQLKAIQIANIANWILIVFIFGGTIYPFFYNKEITFTLTRPAMKNQAQISKNFFEQYYHKLSQDEMNVMLLFKDGKKEMCSDDADPEKEWKNGR